MTFTLHELLALAALIPTCPAELLGPDGYPDPRPLEDGEPSPTFLWMVSELARRHDADPWACAWVGGPRKSWELWQHAGKVQGFRFEDLPSTGMFTFGRETPTPEGRERQVRALIRALAG